MKKKTHKTERSTPPRRYDKAPFRRRAVTLAALAFLLTIVVELGNRGLSVPRLLQFIVGAPLIFLSNALIVLASLVLSELFLRRLAVLSTISVLWLVLGIVQFIIVKDRTTPFTSMDLLLIREGLSLLSIYATLPQIIGVFVGVFLIFALIITLFTRAPRRRRRRLGPALVASAGCLLLCVMGETALVRTGMIPQRFDSLVDDYAAYGFPLVFTYTFGQKGIARPSAYNEDTVGQIMEDIGGEEKSEQASDTVRGRDAARPNLLFIQLESFIDVGTVEGCRVSRDPTPCFNRLRAQYPSGLLYVPTVGGGTVNTEFEIITGMNLDFFGAGESPYSTILQEVACESIAFNLKDYGYTATALHNNSASFYNRNAVYPRLGFDCFVPVEYMQGVHTNAMGWAKDDILTDELLTVMKGTEGPDLALCITVESHGKYAEVYEPGPGDIEVLALPEEVPLAPFQNYVNALPDTDAFLEALIGALSEFDEPTVVVAYGDHLPALSLSAEIMTTQSIYATQYVIWNNFGHAFEAPDMQAYRLNAHILGQLGMTGGMITRLHQSVPVDDLSEDYLSRLELLEYDTLYGDRQVLEEAALYKATDMRLGSREIAITSAEPDYGRLLVTGKNFTGYSRIVLNGEPLETLFIDSRRIIAAMKPDETPIGSLSEAAALETLAVAQVDDEGVELSRTEPFPIGGPAD